jgi:hypothetical protein
MKECKKQYNPETAKMSENKETKKSFRNLLNDYEN